jgi:hypothetical protein
VWRRNTKRRCGCLIRINLVQDKWLTLSRYIVNLLPSNQQFYSLTGRPSVYIAFNCKIVGFTGMKSSTLNGFYGILELRMFRDAVLTTVCRKKGHVFIVQLYWKCGVRSRGKPRSVKVSVGHWPHIGAQEFAWQNDCYSSVTGVLKPSVYKKMTKLVIKSRDFAVSYKTHNKCPFKKLLLRGRKTLLQKSLRFEYLVSNRQRLANS